MDLLKSKCVANGKPALGVRYAGGVYSEADRRQVNVTYDLSSGDIP